MPEALAIAWEVAKSNIPSPDKRDLIAEFDRVLGLDLLSSSKGLSFFWEGQSLKDLPENVQELISAREAVRKNQDWKLSDELRDKILASGYKIEDSPSGPKLSLTSSPTT